MLALIYFIQLPRGDLMLVTHWCDLPCLGCGKNEGLLETLGWEAGLLLAV